MNRGDSVRKNCNCCGKQIVSYSVGKHDEHITEGPAVYDVSGYICRYCSYELDDNGLFLEEQGKGD